MTRICPRPHVEGTSNSARPSATAMGRNEPGGSWPNPVVPNPGMMKANVATAAIRGISRPLHIHGCPIREFPTPVVPSASARTANSRNSADLDGHRPAHRPDLNDCVDHEGQGEGLGKTLTRWPG